MLSWLYEKWSGDTLINSERVNYTYDNNGNQLTSLFETLSGIVWVPDWNYAYAYDNYGNCTHAEHNQWLNGVWIPFGNDFDLWYNHHQNSIYFYASKIEVDYTTITGVADGNLNPVLFKKYIIYY